MYYTSQQKQPIVGKCASKLLEKRNSHVMFFADNQVHLVFGRKEMHALPRHDTFHVGSKKLKQVENAPLPLSFTSCCVNDEQTRAYFACGTTKINCN